MSIVVAHRAVHLGENVAGVELLPLTAQTHDNVGQLLADGGGRRGLAVGAREHGLVGERCCEVH